MKIAQSTVAVIHFQVKDLEGNEITQSEEPTPVLVGHDCLLPGLDTALLDRTAGEQFSVTLPPEQAWGERQEGLVQRVPIKHLTLERKQRLEPGILVEVPGEHGSFQARVLKVGRFNVDLDMNHPLAGMSVVIDVQVDSVREATAEELAHGHVHQGDCDHEKPATADPAN
jgi:FKBP-type peptidyl-prolyl cis-trans isomerase SlyD